MFLSSVVTSVSLIDDKNNACRAENMFYCDPTFSYRVFTIYLILRLQKDSSRKQMKSPKRSYELLQVQ